MPTHGESKAVDSGGHRLEESRKEQKERKGKHTKLPSLCTRRPPPASPSSDAASGRRKKYYGARGIAAAPGDGVASAPCRRALSKGPTCRPGWDDTNTPVTQRTGTLPARGAAWKTPPPPHRPGPCLSERSRGGGGRGGAIRHRCCLLENAPPSPSPPPPPPHLRTVPRRRRYRHSRSPRCRHLRRAHEVGAPPPAPHTQSSCATTASSSDRRVGRAAPMEQGRSQTHPRRATAGASHRHRGGGRGKASGGVMRPSRAEPAWHAPVTRLKSHQCWRHRHRPCSCW